MKDDLHNTFSLLVGEKNFDSKDNLLKREKLKTHPKVEKLIKLFWKTFDGNPRSKNGSISECQYKKLFVLLFKGETILS